MALTHLVEDPDWREHLKKWQKKHREDSNNKTEIQVCGYYFSGNGTVVIWYEIALVDVVVYLEQIPKRQNAPR